MRTSVLASPGIAAFAAGILFACQPRNSAIYPAPNPPATWTAPPPMAASAPAATAPTTPSPPATTEGPSASPLDPSMLGAIALALNADAAIDAPKMAPEGPVLAGTFQEGQALEQPITLMPGRCYTFIAAAAGGIGGQELEIQLIAQSIIPGLVPVMGEQKGAAGKVVLGRGAACIKLALIPVAVPSRWVLKATRGSGIVAGQAFSR